MWKLAPAVKVKAQDGGAVQGGEAMADDSKVPVLVRALDRLKACAEGKQKKVCLTSKECEKICVYIWWLTDRLAEAKGMTEEGDERD